MALCQYDKYFHYLLYFDGSRMYENKMLSLSYDWAPLSFRFDIWEFSCDFRRLLPAKRHTPFWCYRYRRNSMRNSRSMRVPTCLFHFRIFKLPLLAKTADDNDVRVFIDDFMSHYDVNDEWLYVRSTCYFWRRYTVPRRDTIDFMRHHFE